jgi:ethanolamine utilization protein EutQ (cupin superfamily)
MKRSFGTDTAYSIACGPIKPKKIKAAGKPPKTILEFIGRVATETDGLSVARMKSPEGWGEPGQTPDFDEYSLVLEGTLRVETRQGTLEVKAGEAFAAPKGSWVRYSSPFPGGAEYVAVCVPAFAPDLAHRDEE